MNGDSNDAQRGISRRRFLQAAGGTTLALGGAAGILGRIASPAPASAAVSSGNRHNILFILTDQEQYFRELPSGLRLPGRERLRKMGVTFTNHQIASAVCTSSRSVIYTGQHIQHTKLFDNLDFPWTKDLDHEIPTLGDMLGDTGYYAAYKGKWHLSKQLGTHDERALPDPKLTEVVASYGFKDYVGIGDVIGMTQGGYLNDHIIAAHAKRWLRVRGRPMQEQGKPWFLAVNLVNPHDVMFYNTDAPGQAVQDDGRLLMKIAREPDVALYRDQWDMALPESRKQAFDAPGRPKAHLDSQLARGAAVGNFPNEADRWRRLRNYYFNCIRQTDALVLDLLSELDDLGLTENTIIVMTADHGELGGAHGTHGKGATAYQEQNHVPFIVAHPGYAQSAGKKCAALTSHLDIAPTLVAWSGAAPKGLPGRDFTSLLAQPEKATSDALRPGSVYAFNMYAYLDSDFILKVAALLNAGKPPEEIKRLGLRPDMTKRGAIRSVFDGRYKFTRYFSPMQHNAPRTIEEILAVNDVELFDLESDPNEMENLAVDARHHGDLMLAMNAKLNTLIEQEVGEDDGRFLPVGDEVDWAVTKFDP